MIPDKYSKNKSSGFTLVELSVVLVIIGVLIGAVIAGKLLLSVADVRTITSEVEKYQSSIVAFHEKYMSLPGDMSDASTTWTGAGNGDEDGMITWTSGTEGPKMWDHLERSGLSAHVGAMTGTGADAEIGTNIPQSLFGSGEGGYYVDCEGSGDTDCNDSGDYNHLGFGRQDSSGLNDTGILKPQSAYEVDAKMDDGKAGSGRVRGFADSGSCLASGEYDYDDNTIDCYMEFKLNTEL